MPRSFWLGLCTTSLVVLVIAVAFRLPSCHQSYWVDELHSAWTVHDDFRDVTHRAEIGNQTPYYFAALWVWKSLFGEGEVAMRVSSVLLSALGCVVLFAGVSMQTRRLSAGFIAGVILAVDPQAVFFGTELRPYAAVVFLASLAAWSAVGMIQSRARQGWWRCGMFASVCVSGLLQPTSLGVLGVFVLVSLLWLALSGGLRLSRPDGMSLLFVIVTAALLLLSALPAVYAQRDQWRSFGQVESHWRLWDTSWSWVPIMLVPLGLGIAWLIARFEKSKLHSDSRKPPFAQVGGIVPMIGGVLGTVSIFYISYFDWVPLWHRRYFIASLPLLAWGAGWIATMPLARNGIGKLLGLASAGFVLGFMLWYQGSANEIMDGHIPIQHRPEGWREAVALVAQESDADDEIWVDAGLIESSFFAHPKTQVPSKDWSVWEYLSYPVLGPYKLSGATAFSFAEHPSWTTNRWSKLDPATRTIWVINRFRPVEVVMGFANREPANRFRWGLRKQFGTVFVFKAERP